MRCWGIMNPTHHLNMPHTIYITCIDQHKLRKARLPLILTHTLVSPLYIFALRRNWISCNAFKSSSPKGNALSDWLTCPHQQSPHKSSRSLERFSIIPISRDVQLYKQVSIWQKEVQCSIHSSVSRWFFFLIRHDQNVTSPADCLCVTKWSM